MNKNGAIVSLYKFVLVNHERTLAF